MQNEMDELYLCSDVPCLEAMKSSLYSSFIQEIIDDIMMYDESYSKMIWFWHNKDSKSVPTAFTTHIPETLDVRFPIRAVYNVGL